MTITAYKPFRDGSGSILEMRDSETDRFRRDAKLKDLRTHFASHYTFNTFESPELRVDWVTDEFGLCMWWAETPTPQSGYTRCACRDCMDTTVSSDTSKPELCELCREAGCTAIAPYNERVQFCSAYECQRDDAYEGA